LGGAGIVRVLLRDATRLIGEGIRPLDLDARQRRGCFRKARPGAGDVERIARLRFGAGD